MSIPTDTNAIDHKKTVNEVKKSLCLTKSQTGLSHEQRQQLLLVWRQKVQQLLFANSNSLSILAVLEKVSRYLWQSTDDNKHQRLWHLAELWLHDLADNKTPLPKHYAPVLQQLEQRIAVPLLPHRNKEAFLNCDIDGLIVDLHFELNHLVHCSNTTGSTLSLYAVQDDLPFLPHILHQLESVVSDLAHPSKVISPLQKIQYQLDRWGWTEYGAQVEQILAEIKSHASVKTALTQLSERLEDQLQALYKAIEQTKQMIVDKIGLPLYVSQVSDQSHTIDAQTLSSTDLDIPQDSVRWTIATLRQQFATYRDSEQNGVLPFADDFAQMGMVFNAMGLSAFCQLIAHTARLFAPLNIEAVSVMRADMFQALATSLHFIERLVEQLAKQFFDQPLLAHANQHHDRLVVKLAAWMHLSAEPNSAKHEIVHNDDSEAYPSAAFQPIDTSRVIKFSKASKRNDAMAIKDIAPDQSIEGAIVADGSGLVHGQTPETQGKVDIEDKTGAIFRQEIKEVITDLEDFLSIWQQDAQDLTPLMEIRRGFHTVTGSGRMVGATSISEMAWSIENLLNHLLDDTLLVTDEVVTLVTEAITALPLLIADLDSQHLPSFDCSELISKSKHLLDTHVLNAGLPPIDLSDAHLGIDKPRPSTSRNIDQESMTKADQAMDEVEEATSDAKSTKSELFALALPTTLTPFFQEARHLPLDATDADPEIKEIFIEEAQEVLSKIVPVYEEWRLSPTDLSPLRDVRRGFHTLKGSGRMVGAHYMAELAWSIENLLSRVLDTSLTMAADIKQLVADVLAAFPELLATFEASRQDYLPTVPLWVACANAYSRQCGHDFKYANVIDTWFSMVEPQTDHDLVAHTATKRLPFDKDNGSHVNGETSVDSVLQTLNSINEIMAEAPENLIPQSAEEQAFCEIFIEEAETLIQVMKGFVKEYQGAQTIEVNDEIVRAFHTLRSASGHSALAAVSKASALIEQKLEALIKKDKPMNAQQLQVLDQTVILMEGHLDTYKRNVEREKILPQSAFEGPKTASIDTDAKLSIDELLAEDIDALLDAEWHLQTAFNDPDIEQVQAYITQQLTQTTQLLPKVAQSPKFTAILNALNKAYTHLSHHPNQAHDVAVQATLLAGHSQLVGLFDALAGSMSLKIDKQVLKSLQDLPSSTTNNKEIDPVNTAIIPINQGVLVPELQQVATDTDSELLGVFLEEAQEISEALNTSFDEWRIDITEGKPLKKLQRHLHTIKGGARMVGVHSIADLAHEMEAVYEAIGTHRATATPIILEILAISHDWLTDAVFILKQRINPNSPAQLIAALQQFIKNPDRLRQIPDESLQTARQAILLAQNKQQSTSLVNNTGTKDISQMPPMQSTAKQQQSSSHEMIRISNDLMEHMINLSGESTINRTRIDTGISSLTTSIEEMGMTIQRLADQLRRMDLELEVQILSQIDNELMAYEGFDPLEMDQYSSLNQLSKSLTESASDLVDINHTLLEKTRDGEGLLLQLSRTQNELQESLMNARMVPFEQMTPRFERVVRQTASELNKSVQLTIINADNEMDRTILERITSPLEHMLRNAVDHGIEESSARLKAGKTNSGCITLEVLRDGSEIVICLSDDGRGIDVNAVRAQALSHGLIKEHDTELTDLDIMQYIFYAGLTTTKEVTQISGRGVGMDVVVSEIRQLGGVVSVTSEAGEGSRFTIRLPLTVAISDALMVRVADRYYAIPLVQIERVVRIHAKELDTYYHSNAKTLNIENVDYRVRYLNDILSGNVCPKPINNTDTSVSLIVVKNRSGENMALQVDQIAGSRLEVVVKPLGAQLSRVSGISAATIMGNGSVMLILDLMALMRHTSSIQAISKSITIDDARLGTRQTIMVVDDSVTVRKVTSRFLERQGFNVILAKDGIDAIELLQETMPDLILLDIEMPQMDGFEVALQVRNSLRLQHIPIIMITSRTGEKHRERALEVGVADYMGKPFQENQLLHAIHELLGQISLKK